MRRNQNREQADLWLRQARYDLKAARDSLKAGNFEWACFQAQQGAEKALIAYLNLAGERQVLSHSVAALLERCARLAAEFREVSQARELDQYYIPTRYPNGLPGQVPHQYYQKEQAQRCLRLARSVIALVGRLSRR
jgi:HEPN domain-containing protein